MIPFSSKDGQTMTKRDWFCWGCCAVSAVIATYRGQIGWAVMLTALAASRLGMEIGERSERSKLTCAEKDT